VGADLGPLGISVLALLDERPMHPYEMYRLLVERHGDRIVKVRPGSPYHTVDRLAENALADRIRAVLATPVNGFPVFPDTLAEAHNLPRHEVVDLLTTRVTHLEATIADNAAAIGAAATGAAETVAVDEAYLLAGCYVQELLTTELRWLQGLIGRLERKELRWPLEDRL
jgi:hypothetical protein